MTLLLSFTPAPKPFPVPLSLSPEPMNAYRPFAAASLSGFTKPLQLKPAPLQVGLNQKYRRLRGRIFKDRWESRPAPAPVMYLVDRLIPSSALTVLYGESGVGKTKVVLEIANAVANGQAFQGRRSTQADVLYLDHEMGEQQLALYGQKLGLQGFIAPYHDVPLDQIGNLIRMAVAEGCGLVILDSYASVANLTGVEGAVNSNSIAERILKPLADLAHQLGVAVIVLRHTNKTNIVYDASQRLKGLSDVLIKLSLDRSACQLNLVAEKTRVEFEGLAWDASGHPNLRGRSVTEEDESDEQLDWLLEQLEAGPSFLNDLKDAFRTAFNMHPKALDRASDCGVEQGLLVKTKNGRKNHLQLAGAGQPIDVGPADAQV